MNCVFEVYFLGDLRLKSESVASSFCLRLASLCNPEKQKLFGIIVGEQLFQLNRGYTWLSNA